jgi:crossover junction endodeoxyribonuclease RusA
MPSISFFVPGAPKPQGSKRGYVVKGRAVLVESSNGVKDWRGDVKALAQRSKGDIPTCVEGAVSMRIVFLMPRPKYLCTKKRMNDDPPHTSKPDADKLLRAVMDALTGVMFLDDSQVTRLGVEKKYAAYGDAPGANIAVAWGDLI